MRPHQHPNSPVQRSALTSLGLRKALSAALLGLGLLVAQGAAQAQIQRSFINLGFEDPLSGVAASCVWGGPFSLVPGWQTTHPVVSTFYCPGTTGPATGQIIEIWHNNFNDGSGPVAARAGTSHAELNAFNASRLFQSVCLVNGETVPWRLSHRARTGTSTQYDVMEFKVDATTVARLSSSRFSTSLAPSSLGFGGTASRAAAPNGWTDYTGSFVYSGTTGVVNFGFEAISSVSGSTAIGNFLDEIQVTLRPTVEFSSSSSTVIAGNTITFPLLNVSGTVPSGGLTVPVVVSGTATSGSDYTAFTISYVIPAGTYLNQGFAPTTASLATIADTVIEDNETVVLTVSTSASVTVSSLSTCGGAARAVSTITIQDDDVDLKVTKAVSNATPNLAQAFTYTVTFSNNTARPTIAPLTAHDVTAAVADAVPANMTFTSWTCAASSGATCPAASGSGAISGNAVLPAGASGAAGGSVTYTIQAVVNAQSACATTLTNTGTITVPAGFQEGTSVQSGFTTPAPGGAADNTASVDVALTCSTDLQLTKTNNLPGTVDQANDTVTRGQATTYRIIVTNNGPAPVTGAVVNDPSATGLTCTSLTCTGTACPSATPAVSALQAGLALGALAVSDTVTLNLTCTVN
jgi:uncharacterized repeat protein (TIGR01451 family)